MSVKTLKKTLRKFIPFPKRKTLKRWFPSKYTRNVVHLLRKKNITTVLDLGANIGQYANRLRSAGYKGEIISFEPIAAPYEKLKKEAADDVNWRIAPRMAIGNDDGEIEINKYSSDDMSSILQLKDDLPENIRKATPNLAHTAVEKVPVKKLDSIFDEYVSNGEKTLLKIDVQGFEKQVLEGAAKSLEKIEGIQIELSLIPIYEGETHYLDMLTYLKNLGFSVYFFLPVTNKIKMGRIDQIDALLFKGK